MPADISKETRHDPAIEFLAREACRPIKDVELLYGEELVKLAVGARVTSFLPILALRQAREVMRREKSGKTG